MKIFKIALIALVMIFSVPAEIYSQTFRVKVERVSDGDTFRAKNRDDLLLVFRMHGIDAPEKSQPYSNKSKEYLEELILQKSVMVTVMSRDSYGRYVVKVATPSVKDVSLKLLERGYAWHYKQYDKSAEYDKAEKAAKAAKKGLWADKNPTAPWDFRKKK